MEIIYLRCYYSFMFTNIFEITDAIVENFISFILDSNELCLYL